MKVKMLTFGATPRMVVMLSALAAASFAVAPARAQTSPPRRDLR